MPNNAANRTRSSADRWFESESIADRVHCSSLTGRILWARRLYKRLENPYRHFLKLDESVDEKFIRFAQTLSIYELIFHRHWFESSFVCFSYYFTSQLVPLRVRLRLRLMIVSLIDAIVSITITEAASFSFLFDTNIARCLDTFLCQGTKVCLTFFNVCLVRFWRVIKQFDSSKFNSIRSSTPVFVKLNSLLFTAFRCRTLPIKFFSTKIEFDTFTND